mgnify:CR=1 FL=1
MPQSEAIAVGRFCPDCKSTPHRKENCWGPCTVCNRRGHKSSECRLKDSGVVAKRVQDEEEKKDGGPSEFSGNQSQFKSDIATSGGNKGMKEGFSNVRMPFRQNTEYESMLLNIASQMPKRKIKFDL